MSSLKKFHWHFKFPCKTIQSISSQTSLIVGEGFHISHEYFTSNLISKDRTQIRTPNNGILIFVFKIPMISKLDIVAIINCF